MLGGARQGVADPDTTCIFAHMPLLMASHHLLTWRGHMHAGSDLPMQWTGTATLLMICDTTPSATIRCFTRLFMHGTCYVYA